MVEIIGADELMAAFAGRIAEGFLYGDFQFSTDPASDGFLRRGVFASYRPVDPATPVPAEPPRPRARADHHLFAGEAAWVGDDPAQGALLALYRGMGSFRGQSAFSTWMYRVTTNACHDLARRNARHPRTVPLDEGRSSAGTEPLDDAALDRLIATGVVTPDTLVWKAGMADWQPLAQARPRDPSRDFFRPLPGEGRAGFLHFSETPPPFARASF